MILLQDAITSFYEDKKAWEKFFNYTGNCFHLKDSILNSFAKFNFVSNEIRANPYENLSCIRLIDFPPFSILLDQYSNIMTQARLNALIKRKS